MGQYSCGERGISNVFLLCHLSVVQNCSILFLLELLTTLPGGGHVNTGRLDRCFLVTMTYDYVDLGGSGGLGHPGGKSPSVSCAVPPFACLCVFGKEASDPSLLPHC